MKEKHYLGNKLVEVKKAEPKNALLMASEASESKLSEASWSNSLRAPTAGATAGMAGALGVMPLVPGLVPVVASPRARSSADGGNDSAEGLWILLSYLI